jgi:hypothetical protein
MTGSAETPSSYESVSNSIEEYFQIPLKDFNKSLVLRFC